MYGIFFSCAVIRFIRCIIVVSSFFYSLRSHVVHFFPSILLTTAHTHTVDELRFKCNANTCQYSSNSHFYSYFIVFIMVLGTLTFFFRMFLSSFLSASFILFAVYISHIFFGLFSLIVSNTHVNFKSWIDKTKEKT